MQARLSRIGRQIARNWGLYLLLLPSLVLLIIFAYKPMYGVIIAFKKYKNALSIPHKAALPTRLSMVTFQKGGAQWPVLPIKS